MLLEVQFFAKEISGKSNARAMLRITRIRGLKGLGIVTDHAPSNALNITLASKT